MLLSELEWISASSNAMAMVAIVRRDREYLLTIYRFRDGNYSIYINDYSAAVQNVDALTAQAVLFEITREGNDAAK